MANVRKIILCDGEYYHIFNRGIEQRSVFTGSQEYRRFMKLVTYYQFKEPTVRFSHFTQLSKDQQNTIWQKLQSHERLVTIQSYCLMPNHFHFLLRQEISGGIRTYIAAITNAYTKYFNIKYDRVGPLFQGVFKAVHVETDEQFDHLSRYIHLNPVTASLINSENVDEYPWSSMQAYQSEIQDELTDKQLLLSHFKSPAAYRIFVVDQADYAKRLGVIKHLTHEYERV